MSKLMDDNIEYAKLLSSVNIANTGLKRQLSPSQVAEYIERLIEEEGFDAAMTMREVHNDITFLRCYMDEKFVRDMNYFSYSFKKSQKSITVDDISDVDGWENVRDELIKNTGLNRVPVVYVDEVEKDNTLALVHEHDGRDLDLSYGEKVFNYISTLWGDNIKLVSFVENEIWEF